MSDLHASDRAEICALEAAYGPRWDAADATGWAALYTEDGVFAVARPDHTPEVRARGRAELAGRCDLFNETRQGVHLLQHPEITVDGDRARSIIPFTFWGTNRSGSGTLEVGGVYKVEYQRTDEGWRIRHRYEIPTTRRTADQHVRDIDGIGWLSDQV